MLPQFKKEFLNTIKSDKMIEIVEILDRASPLLSLQIAAQDWDL